MKQVALIRNTASKYGVLGSMTEALATAFTRLGIENTVYDPRAVLEKVRSNPPDCTWGMNILLDENVLFRPFGVPHVTLSVDTVIHSLPSALDMPHAVQLFVDNSSCEFLTSHGVKKALWFPHAIAQETLDAVRLIPLDERPYDVALIGSYFPKRKGLAPPLSNMVDRALESFFFPFLQESLNAITDIPQLENVEIALRRADRERIVKVLRGRSIHIFTGIEDAVVWTREEPNQNYIFHLPVAFRDVARLCCQSRVVINSSPHIRPGYHERLFLSLASGAITLVERGRLPAWLVDEGRIVEYDSATLESVPHRLIEAQSRPYNREKVLSWLSSEHTWDARLKQLLPSIEGLIAS